MGRWSRSGLRVSGIGVVAVVGAALLFVPPAAAAGEKRAAAVKAGEKRAAAVKPGEKKADTGDRLTVVAGDKGGAAIRFRPASGDGEAPYSFVSAGGTVRARELGVSGAGVAEAPTGGPVRAERATTAAAMYKTTFKVASSNKSATGKTIALWNRSSNWAHMSNVANPANSLTATANLAPGDYFVASTYGIRGVNSYLLTKTFTVTNKAQTVTLAESSAKEVAIRVDDKTAQRAVNTVSLTLPHENIVGLVGGPGTTRTYVTTASVAGSRLWVHELLHKAGTSAVKNSPYRYDLVKDWAHPLPASLISTVRTASLARTTTTVRGQGINASGTYETASMTGDWLSVYLASHHRFPATITEYVTPGARLTGMATYGVQQHLALGERALPAGATASRTVGAAPFMPGLAPLTVSSSDYYSRRDGDAMFLFENMPFSDGAGNRGYDYSATTSMSLSSGGEVLATSSSGTGRVSVPTGERAYELVHDSKRRVPYALLSTGIRSEWSFTSAPGDDRLPLVDVGLAATGLDSRNRAWSTPVGLTATAATRGSAGAVTSVDAIEWSVNDGATWTGLPLTAAGDDVRASLAVPASAKYVSLRLTASNDRGGKLVRTVKRALAGPVTPGDETVGRTTISKVKINNGAARTVGATKAVELTATFTVSDPAGIAKAGLYLWHGSNYVAPDGFEIAHTTDCRAANATTANCTATVSIDDHRWSLAGNALAGAWRVGIWATSKDGKSFTDRHAAGTMTFKRATRLSANATPEPVKKKKTVTVKGTLTRQDWTNWTYKAYAGRPVSLQFRKLKTKTWVTLKKGKSSASGAVKLTTPAKADGHFRLVYAADATSAAVYSYADYVDVK